jgi:hypothetical protein
MQNNAIRPHSNAIASTSAVPPTALVPDFDEATAFLTALDLAATSFTFQTFADDKRRKGLTASKAASLIDAAPLLIAANRSGSGVFVTVNAMDASGERKLANFNRVRAVWAELDNGMPSTPWPLEVPRLLAYRR